MRLKVLPTLFEEDGSDLAHILADNLKATGWKNGSGTVLLCDHGSPVKEVTECRNRLAALLRKELRLRPDQLIACSMERREGPEYEFNEPLLEGAIQHAEGEAIILMMFLLPGRHAGPDGDVASIAKDCAPAGVRWKLSPLIGSHEMLPAMLGMKLDHVPEDAGHHRRLRIPRRTPDPALGATICVTRMATAQVPAGAYLADDPAAVPFLLGQPTPQELRQP
jgi:hypothetical protein